VLSFARAAVAKGADLVVQGKRQMVASIQAGATLASFILRLYSTGTRKIKNAKLNQLLKGAIQSEKIRSDRVLLFHSPTSMLYLFS